jgi:hypothetical protein
MCICPNCAPVPSILCRFREGGNLVGRAEVWTLIINEARNAFQWLLPEDIKPALLALPSMASRFQRESSRAVDYYIHREQADGGCGVPADNAGQRSRHGR